MTTVLRAWRRDGVTALGALDAWAAALIGGVCVLYAPSALRVAQLIADGGLVNAGGAVAVGDAFELRCFNDQAELRWLRHPAGSGGAGSAVALSEDAPAEVPAGWDRLPDLEAVEVIDHQYLLWGEVSERANAGVPPGFVALEAARIGCLIVPCPDRPGSGGRLALRAREYVCVVTGRGSVAAGNAYVAEERLLAFTGAQRESETERRSDDARR